MNSPLHALAKKGERGQRTERWTLYCFEPQRIVKSEYRPFAQSDSLPAARRSLWMSDILLKVDLNGCAKRTMVLAGRLVIEVKCLSR